MGLFALMYLEINLPPSVFMYVCGVCVYVSCVVCLYIYEGETEKQNNKYARKRKLKQKLILQTCWKAEYDRTYYKGIVQSIGYSSLHRNSMWNSY